MKIEELKHNKPLEIKDVINFELLEQYIEGKHRMLNVFENQIVHYLSHRFREYQLFFLVRDARVGTDLEVLKERYYHEINGKYSPHQTQHVALANQDGDFFVRSHGIHLVSKEGPRASKLEWENYEKWGRFDEIFTLNKDYQVLYSSPQLTIIVFCLKLIEARYCVQDNTTHILENGYFTSTDFNPCDILEFDRPYDYHYFNIPYSNMSQSEYTYMKNYYDEQKRLLQHNLKRSREFVANSF